MSSHKGPEGTRSRARGKPATANRRILIAVTIDDSLQFHEGLPAALVERGWEVHIACSPGRRLSALSAVRGVHTHPIEMERKPRFSRDLVTFGRWLRLLGAIRPHVVLIGTPKASLLGIVAARLVRVPRRVYVLHGLRLETIGGVKRFIFAALEKLTCSSATHVIAVSESLRALALRMNLVSPANIHVIGHGSTNGVDIDRFAGPSNLTSVTVLRRSLQLDPELPVVGFVGRLTRDKGLPELAKALQILKKRGVLLQLLAVGDVDDPTGLEGVSELRGSGQKIVLSGYVEETAPYYALMDVFCIPSLREGLPTVVLEAMASRVPVVATDATGLVDLVRNGVSGSQVTRGSEHALADALALALHDRNGAQTMVENAFQMVETYFPTPLVQSLLMDYLEHLGMPKTS